MTKIHTLFFVRTFAVVTMKVFMNKTTIFSLTSPPGPLSKGRGGERKRGEGRMQNYPIPPTLFH